MGFDGRQYCPKLHLDHVAYTYVVPYFIGAFGRAYILPNKSFFPYFNRLYENLIKKLI